MFLGYIIDKGMMKKLKKKGEDDDRQERAGC